MKFLAAILFFVSVNAMAQSSTTIPTSGGTQTSATSVKDAKESCKKDGKEGKDLVNCIKEKVK